MTPCTTIRRYKRRNPSGKVSTVRQHTRKIARQKEQYGFGITNPMTGTRAYVGPFSTKLDAIQEMERRKRNGKNPRLVKRKRFSVAP